MQIIRIILACLCLAACGKAPGNQVATQQPVQVVPCTEKDYFVFPSQEGETFRLHTVKLSAEGQKTGNEIHLDAELQGDDEQAKLALVAVEFLYAEQEGETTQHYRVRFVRGLAGGFSALLASGPGVRAEQLVSDKSVEDELVKIFADGDQTFGKVGDEAQGELKGSKQKALEAALTTYATGVFCRRADLKSWGDVGRVYFQLWKPAKPEAREHGEQSPGRVALKPERKRRYEAS